METKNLFKAISAFQNEVPVIHQESSGYGYTYANLNSIFKIINPLLKKHGLGYSQLLSGDSLRTIIFHMETGETIESSVNILQGVTLAKMNPYQVLGSAITYYRRYSLSAALGLITDKDTDAGGEAEKPKQQTAQPKVELPYLEKTMTAYPKAIEKLIAGTTTIVKIETVYRLTPEIKDDLITQSLKQPA